jgi:hypothetical protein
LATYNKNEVDALFYYSRSLFAVEPFNIAYENINSLCLKACRSNALNSSLEHTIMKCIFHAIIFNRELQNEYYDSTLKSSSSQVSQDFLTSTKDFKILISNSITLLDSTSDEAIVEINHTNILIILISIIHSSTFYAFLDDFAENKSNHNYHSFIILSHTPKLLKSSYMSHILSKVECWALSLLYKIVCR